MRFPRIAMSLFALAALFTLILQSLPAEAQQRSEKAAETSAENRAATEKSKSKEEKKEEEKGMRYRMIGPYRGGRSLTAVGVPGDASTYYFGATGGGVWKSTDGALSWKPIFDH